MRISAHLDMIFDGLTLKTAVLQYFMLHFELNAWYNNIVKPFLSCKALIMFHTVKKRTGNCKI